MKRKEFLSTCGLGCLGLLSSSLLLSSCVGVKYVQGSFSDSSLNVPLNSFELIKKEELTYRKYIVVQHEKLQYPICVYRLSVDEYQALWMKCTHQGTELRAYGDRLQCPAHGSEFTQDGTVQNGPADKSLRTFPVQIENNMLKIQLS
jgi:Rieske Fe-S protein